MYLLNKTKAYILAVLICFVTTLTFCDGQTSHHHPCDRDCSQSHKNYICKYTLVIENYPTLSPACGNCPVNKTDCLNDQCVVGCGFSKMMCSINRQQIGPTIQCCMGDRIQVTVINKMSDQETSLHWHGFHQAASPWMDGPPKVTQCPIPPGNTFVYTVTPDAPGNYWYHSHSNLQTLAGCVGALRVHGDVAHDPLKMYYDVHLSEPLLITEFFCKTNANDHLPGIPTATPTGPDRIFINGRGIHIEDLNQITPRDVEDALIPPATFTVESGLRVKIDIIGGVSVCRVCIGISNHRLGVIALDGGQAVKIKWVHEVCVGPGDRFATVVHTNQPPGAYWIRAVGLADCKDTWQVGIFRYAESNEHYPNHPVHGISTAPKSALNYPGGGCNRDDVPEVCISEMESLENDEDLKVRICPQVLHLQLGFKFLDNEEFFSGKNHDHYLAPTGKGFALSANINNISYVLPPSPLLTQYCDIPKSSFCSPECLSGEHPELCFCTAVYKFRKDEMLYIIISEQGTNKGGINHPFHLHGFNFAVLHQGYFAPGPRRPQEETLINYALDGKFNLKHAPKKDTILIPAAGYAVIAFITDNPGMWYFHCHLLFHQDTGMAGVLQVGELSDFVPPPEDFPKCGNFYGNSHRSHAAYCATEERIAKIFPYSFQVEPNPGVCEQSCPGVQQIEPSFRYRPCPSY